MPKGDVVDFPGVDDEENVHHEEKKKKQKKSGGFQSFGLEPQILKG